MEPTTADPTMIPTEYPSSDPTVNPLRIPSQDPTADQSIMPTVRPTVSPTEEGDAGVMDGTDSVETVESVCDEEAIETLTIDDLFLAQSVWVVVLVSFILGCLMNLICCAFWLGCWKQKFEKDTHMKIVDTNMKIDRDGNVLRTASTGSSVYVKSTDTTPISTAEVDTADHSAEMQMMNVKEKQMRVVVSKPMDDTLDSSSSEDGDLVGSIGSMYEQGKMSVTSEGGSKTGV